jgi:transposase InsO family protein
MPNGCNGFGSRQKNAREGLVDSDRLWSNAFEHNRPTRSGVGICSTTRQRHGRSLRILSLIDEYTKECWALQVGYSLRAMDAVKVLEAAIARYGSPEYLRSDNGPEFIAKAIQDWTKEQRIGSIYITPGSPWEQGHAESFHDKLRDECLNRELFGSLAEARVILEEWRVEYNQLRPHSSLGYRTSEEFAARHNLKWGVVSKDLNNPKRLFTTGTARADRFREAVSPAPVEILRTTP